MDEDSFPMSYDFDTDTFSFFSDDPDVTGV